MAARPVSITAAPRPDEPPRSFGRHHLPCTSGISQEVLSPKSIPSKTTKQLASFLALQQTSAARMLQQTLSQERKGSAPISIRSRALVFERDSKRIAGQQSGLPFIGDYTVNRKLIRHARLPPRSSCWEPRQFFGDQHLCDPERRVRNNKPNSFGLQRCAKLV